jgi:hypothetical protein
MPFMLARFDVGDYEAWKPMFDSDPVGRHQVAKGHRLLRNVDDPNEVFVQLEFDSLDEAKSFREKLLASGALDRVTIKTPPTVADVAEAVTY